MANCKNSNVYFFFAQHQRNNTVAEHMGQCCGATHVHNEKKLYNTNLIFRMTLLHYYSRHAKNCILKKLSTCQKPLLQGMSCKNVFSYLMLVTTMRSRHCSQRALHSPLTKKTRPDVQLSFAQWRIIIWTLLACC